MDISTEKIAEMVKRALLEINGASETKNTAHGEIPIGVSNIFQRLTLKPFSVRATSLLP